jgi:hypothetical protein
LDRISCNGDSRGPFFVEGQDSNLYLRQQLPERPDHPVCARAATVASTSEQIVE